MAPLLHRAAINIFNMCNDALTTYNYMIMYVLAYVITSPAGAVAKYCDEHVLCVCVCVCLSVCLYPRNNTSDLYQFVCACCL